MWLEAAIAAIRAYEPLLIEEPLAISGVTLYGIIDPNRFDRRVPTVAFTLQGYTPRQVAERLGKEGIFVWDGNYYALAVVSALPSLTWRAFYHRPASPRPCLPLYGFGVHGFSCRTPARTSGSVSLSRTKRSCTTLPPCFLTKTA